MVFAWAFPLRESLNIGLGTFINNGLLGNPAINNQVIRSFGFDDFPQKTVSKNLEYGMASTQLMVTKF